MNKFTEQDLLRLKKQIEQEILDVLERQNKKIDDFLQLHSVKLVKRISFQKGNLQTQFACPHCGHLISITREEIEGIPGSLIQDCPQCRNTYLIKKRLTVIDFNE